MNASTTYPRIGDVAKALEAWAPPGSAQSYDNVGLQVGDARREVRRALVALDLTPAVVDEAQQDGATLIVTHHPLLFKPLRSVTHGGFVSSLALRLAEAGIALYSIHTNLDAAPGGVSFALAGLLGLTDVRFLDHEGETVYKLATIVPSRHVETVRDALAEAGVGRISACDATAYAPPSKDPSDSASVPVGGMRLEAEIARWDLSRVVRTLRAVHPFEHAAYDVYPVEQPYTGAGLGAIGRLPAPMPLSSFLQRVAEALPADSLRYAGEADALVHTVAVCGGSGSGFTRRALDAGADAYVTADVTYHTFFDVLDVDGRPRMALIDAGHYETEAVTEALLQNWLRQRFPAVAWRRTTTRTSPVHTFIPAAR